MLQNLALSESGFLFDAHTGSTFSLNKTGTFLLRALIDGTRPEDLTELLTQHYEVNAETAGRDVEQFMFRLKDLGLLIEDEELYDGNEKGGKPA
jgi:hypothetical protein